jgi:hypothetical protein
MTVSKAGRELACQLFAALECPAAADRNALLNAASAFLDACPSDASAGADLARTLAARAADYAILGGADDYARLVRAAHCFRMHSAIQQLEL